MAGFANYMAPVLIGAPDNFLKRFLSRLSQTSYFASWLAGLFEGDGHVWIPKMPYAPSGKRYTPHVEITFCISDSPLANWLLSILGGHVRAIGKGACRLTISNVPQLIAFVKLVSPFLRTPKLSQLNRLVDWLNDYEGQTLPHAILDTSPLGTTGWLAGFAESDGNFLIRVTEIIMGAAKNRVTLRFMLEQRMVDSNSGLEYHNIMNAIAKYLGGTLYITHHNGREYYCVQVSSVVQLTILMNYLDQYPLLSGKRMDWLASRRCFDLITSKAHLTPEGRVEALKLKASMNSKRTEWDWSHLDTLSSVLA